MRRFITRLLLFVLIPIILNAIFVVITPSNLFTFRAWEALTPLHTEWFLGPFYPNQSLTLTEIGDLGVGTKYAIPKSVTFITDRYGYRYHHPLQSSYDVVIVGDSFTVGSSVTQSDTLAEALMRQINQTVYPFAPTNFAAASYALTERPDFISEPPKVVILETVEHFITPSICSNLATRPRKIDNNDLAAQDVQQDIKAALAIFADRFLRNTTYLTGFVKSRLSEHSVIAAKQGMLFLGTDIAMQNTDTINAIVYSLQKCKEWAQQHGMRFVFLPIPDKENVYYDSLPGQFKSANPTFRRNAFLRELIARVDQSGIAVVNMLDAFEAAKSQDMQLWQLDDTHWNSTAIKLTAEELANLLAVN